ncbi:hypothetical protein GQ600_3909 [Phytophthora cactorum]|nr:hypothetical protein GQ600_3909 [Phytophthora cactorum]
MRGAKYFCITTECLRYALAYFDPEYVESRSRAAVKMYIFRFLRRNRLTYRRITHRGRVPRPDMQLVADRFSKSMLHHIESNAFFPVGMSDRYDYVFNMDQTSVCVDMNTHSTIEFVGARTVDVVQCMYVNVTNFN